ncbi:MAG: thymidylate synthase [Patescibacteria group bacterium]
MKEYLALVRDVLSNGVRKGDPQGVGNISVFVRTHRYLMSEGFPLITTRSLKGSWKALVHELLWFLSGSSNVADLQKHGVHFWDQWGSEEICARYGREVGDLGPIYGPQWVRWQKRDGALLNQISAVIDEIRRNPNSRRLIVTAWNPEDADTVFIAPCHHIFKFYVVDGKLSLHLTQRSADVLIGVPFNIASYSLLLHMVAQVTGLVPHEFIHTTEDTHIYLDQIPFAGPQLEREPRALPRVVINPEVQDIFRFRFDDFQLEDYRPHPAIKDIPVAL